MFHQQWLNNVQQLLGEIEASYSESSTEQRAKYQQRWQQIKQSCHDLLHVWAVAEEQLDQLRKQHPGLAEADEITEDEFVMEASAVRHFRQGQGYYQLAMFHEATPLFAQLIEREPDFLLGRLYYALSLLQQKELGAAEQQLHVIVETAEGDDFIGIAHQLLGCIAVQEQDDQQARYQFSKAALKQAQNGDAWFNLAACHYRLEQYADAIPYFFHALSCNGEDWEAMFYLSKCYERCQQHESVAFWRQQAYEKMQHPRMITVIAQDYEEQRDHSQAVQWYRRLLAQDRKNAHAYRGLAWNTWMLDQPSEATAWLKKGLSLHPQDAYLLLLHFWLCLQTGQLQQADKIASVLPANVADDPVWFALQSRYFTQLGDYRQALAVTERLIQQEKPEIQALGCYQRGIVLLETKRVAEALPLFQQARQLLPTWQDPLFFAGVCHLVQLQPEETRACWEQLGLPL